MESIKKILTDIDPIKLIYLNRNNVDEYTHISYILYDIYSKKNKLYKFETFQTFENVYWQGSCPDRLCTLITDMINTRLLNS